MINHSDYPSHRPPRLGVDIGIGIAFICAIIAAFWIVCLLARDWMYVALEWFQRVGKGG
ncbi:MAG: hypothetical protein ABIK28_18175 [Planctomycetota bacterium]